MSSPSIENTEKLSYRLYQDNDMEGVLELWEKYSGWGGITEKQFVDWHINTPLGPCIIVVALDSAEQIVGQIVFVPSVVYAAQKENTAYRVMAPIINAAVRGADIKNFDHPAFSMLRFGMDEAKKRGNYIIYFIPSVGWLNVLKTFSKFGLPQPSMSSFGCLRISLSDETLQLQNLNEAYYIQQGSFGEEYDALWTDSAARLPLIWAVKRSADWLRWKRGNHLLLEMRDRIHHKLKGYVVIKRSAGLIVDILAPSIEEMQGALQHTVHWLQQRRINNESRLAEIKLMQTPVMEQVVQPIQHDTLPYRFAFAWLSLNGCQQISEEETFIMPDD